MTAAREVAFDVLPCNCTAEHRPSVPYCHLHHLDPVGEGGPDTAENRISVCPATHDWTHVIFRGFQKAGKVIPRRIGQPRYAYRLAVRGYTRMIERRAGGSP